jgi:hypothetical protein
LFLEQEVEQEVTTKFTKWHTGSPMSHNNRVNTSTTGNTDEPNSINKKLFCNLGDESPNNLQEDDEGVSVRDMLAQETYEARMDFFKSVHTGKILRVITVKF